MSTRTITGYFRDVSGAPPTGARIDIGLAGAIANPSSGVSEVAGHSFTVGSGINATTGAWSASVIDSDTTGTNIRVRKTINGAPAGQDDYYVPAGSTSLDVATLTPGASSIPPQEVIAARTRLSTDASTYPTLRDRLDAAVPVSPEDFGAVGDGVTDDYASLAAALAAHGVITLREGSTYLLGSRLTIPDDCTVMGYGATLHGAIQMGSNTRLIGTKVYRTATATSLQSLVILSGASNVLIDKCHLEHAGTGTSYGVIYSNDASTSKVTIRDTYLTCPNSDTNGIKAVGKYTADVGLLVSDWLITGCRFENIGRMGLEFQSDLYVWTTGLAPSLFPVGRYVTTDNGFYVYKCTVQGAGNTADEPVHTSGSVTGADGYEWEYIGSDAYGYRNVTISDCVIKDTKKASTYGMGVSFTGYGYGCEVASCTFDNIGGGAAAAQAYNVENVGCQGLAVTNNIFQNVINDVFSYSKNSNSGKMYRQVITGNRVIGQGADRAYLSYLYDSTIANNVFVLTSRVSLEFSHRCQVIGNHFKNAASASAVCLELGSSASNRFAHNTFQTTGSTNQVILISGTASINNAFVGNTLLKGSGGSYVTDNSGATSNTFFRSIHENTIQISYPDDFRRSINYAHINILGLLPALLPAGGSASVGGVTVTAANAGNSEDVSLATDEITLVCGTTPNPAQAWARFAIPTDAVSVRVRGIYWAPSGTGANIVGVYVQGYKTADTSYTNLDSVTSTVTDATGARATGRQFAMKANLAGLGYDELAIVLSGTFDARITVAELEVEFIIKDLT